MIDFVVNFVCPAVFLLVPFLIGCILLIKYGKDHIAKNIGFLSLIPVLINVIGIYMESNRFWKIGEVYLYEIEDLVLVMLPSILMLIIIFNSWQLSKKEKLLRSFLAASIVSWLYNVIYFGFLKTYPEPYFYWQAYLAIFFSFIFPSLYSIAGLISIRKHSTSRN